MMIKGSKAHLKEVEKHTDFFRWPNSHGRPAQDDKFSKMKNFNNYFDLWPFQVGLPLDGFRLNFLI
jgi:hypothetical protein